MIPNISSNVDSYNDYYPLGMQMPGRNSVSSADARYKFIPKMGQAGKECFDEIRLFCLPSEV